MTAVFRLDQLLSEMVSVPTRNLVTRPTGAAVRDRLLLQLQDQLGEAHLDFSRIGVVDFSCADEVVAKLLVAIESLPTTRLVLKGVHPHHADAIDHALGRQGLTVVALMDGAICPCLLGLASADTHDVFRALDTLGRSTVEMIAARLDWSPMRTAQALADLIGRRCALVHPDASYELGVLS